MVVVDARQLLLGRGTRIRDRARHVLGKYSHMSPADPPPVGGDELESLILESSADELQRAEQGLRTRLAHRVLAELSDEALAVAIQKSFLTDDAFEELFAVRGEHLLASWFFRWNVNVDDARELTQELYVRFWENRLRTYNPDEGLFRVYLKTSARHRLLEEKRKRRPPGCVPSDQLEPIPAPDDPVEEAIAGEFQERVEEGIKWLPGPERAILRLQMAGKTPGEMAEELGINKVRVYKLLFEARRHLESFLSGRIPH